MAYTLSATIVMLYASTTNIATPHDSRATSLRVLAASSSMRGSGNVKVFWPEKPLQCCRFFNVTASVTSFVLRAERSRTLEDLSPKGLSYVCVCLGNQARILRGVCRASATTVHLHDPPLPPIRE